MVAEFFPDPSVLESLVSLLLKVVEARVEDELDPRAHPDLLKSQWP